MHRCTTTLLELEPFDFRFSNYGLRMQGLNNFNGDLYYHIGVERNPLHIPFGIIIEGGVFRSEAAVREGAL